MNSRFERGLILWILLVGLGCEKRDSNLHTELEQEQAPGIPGAFVQEVSWSPDGSQLALSILQDNIYRIYTMNSDGTQLTKLTDGPWDLWSCWSPDGSQLAFGAKKENNSDIYVINADGTGLTRLTTDSTQEGAPSWSPDGNKISFCSKREGKWQLYLMNRDGSAPTRLSDGSANDENPAWSPNGEKLVFFSNIEGTDYIYLMNTDGTNRIRLTHGVFPFWSPDGARLVFDYQGHIYSIKTDGTEQTKLVENGFSAELSPDGRKIAFIRPKLPNSWPTSADVYIANLDGSGEKRMTNNDRDTSSTKD